MTTRRFWRRQLAPADGTLTFVCNICSTEYTAARAVINRETPTCPGCNSTVRFRSIIAALSTSLFGKSLTIDQFPHRPDLVAIGMSDWEGYADRLASRFQYRNTFFDEPPQLDIMEPVSGLLTHSCDFIISTDVLEHVAPPFELALVHLREMLKPGGLLVFSIPMKHEGSTDEHYPDLHEYKIVDLGSAPVLVNRTVNGELQVFENLVFHGGPGAVLEMRLVSVPDLLANLRNAGFVNIRPFDQTIEQHGIIWNEQNTWPILANAPG